MINAQVPAAAGTCGCYAGMTALKLCGHDRKQSAQSERIGVSALRKFFAEATAPENVGAQKKLLNAKFKQGLWLKEKFQILKVFYKLRILLTK